MRDISITGYENQACRFSAARIAAPARSAERSRVRIWKLSFLRLAFGLGLVHGEAA